MDKDKVRALMILGEIEVDVAKLLTHEKFEIIYSKTQDIRSIILDQIFPQESTITAEINWSEISKS
jgi:hypothetical protein